MKPYTMEESAGDNSKQRILKKLLEIEVGAARV
jgi:hypothetical protein